MTVDDHTLSRYFRCMTCVLLVRTTFTFRPKTDIVVVDLWTVAHKLRYYIVNVRPLSLQETSIRTGRKWCAGWRRRRRMRRPRSCAAGPEPWMTTATRRWYWAPSGSWTAACSSGPISSPRWCWSSAATSIGWTTADGR